MITRIQFKQFERINKRGRKYSNQRTSNTGRRRFYERTTRDIIQNRKRKWIDFSSNDFDDELSTEVHGLIDTAYSNIGGHFKMKTPSEVYKNAKNKYRNWSAIDIDDDPDADAVTFGKQTKYGNKFAGSGHDGTKKAKREFLNNIGTRLKTRGFYGEVSDVLAEILVNKYNVPIVTDAEIIETVLGKDIDFVGTVPGSNIYGWYYRGIAGKLKAKILVGNPII